MLQMTNTTCIRRAVSADYDALADVMFDAVRNGPSAYSEEQRRAWVPYRRTGDEWTERLRTQTIFVSETAEQIVGFMSVTADGDIDLAYVRTSAQRTGIFRRLCRAVENQMSQTNEKRLRVHASLLAQPAFSAMGFSIVQKESVEIRGNAFKRFEMEKYLSNAESNQAIDAN